MSPSISNASLCAISSPNEKGSTIADRNGMTLMGVWNYLNEIKVVAVKVVPKDQWLEVKQECDDLFRQASGGRFDICPAWILGGLGKRG